MYLLLSLFLSCTSQIEEFPTKKQIVESEAHEDAIQTPPLYQLLYDSHPQPTQEQQRVRVFLWLQTLQLTAAQIRRLEILRQDVVSRQKNIEELERQILQQFIAQEQPIYNTFWEALQNGRNIEDLTEEIGFDSMYAGSLGKIKEETAEAVTKFELVKQAYKAVKSCIIGKA